VAEAVGGACQWVLGGRWMMGGNGSGSGAEAKRQHQHANS